jgi:hypothetical protein
MDLSMPSKGGRSSTAAVMASAVGESLPLPVSATTVAPAPAARQAIFALADEQLNQSLRRGVEVNRFNELARRQETLSLEELDELYGYRLRRLFSRLRRLNRIVGSEDAETIRTALDDLDERIEELRRIEETRNAAGLSVADQVDLSHRQAAVDRLLELSRRRPAGLIAGSENARPRETGTVRLNQTRFAPSPDDVPVYVLAPASIPSEAVARNVESVAGEGARVRLVHDANEIPRDGERLPLVLNWGGGESLPAGVVALNRPESVRISSDQVESLRRLGELAPRTVERPDDTGLLGTEQVVAKRRHGARGSGKSVIRADAGWSERVRYDLFQEFIPERREWRISVLSGRIVSAYEKRPPEGTSPEELRPDWSFEQSRVLPAAVASTAREAARRIGVDYAGVDVVEDLRTGRILCLEANAAPGMSVETVRSLYAHIQQTLRGRSARAS